MNLLYLGKYKGRFQPVIQEIKNLPLGARVLELCFGDIYVADFCKKEGYIWTGLDINVGFVNFARKMGFQAKEVDARKIQVLPKADICIMIGSLYHFHYQAGEILAKMLEAAKEVVISEPILNLSAGRGLIAMLARMSANAGNGREPFRYTEESLISTIQEHAKKLNYSVGESRNLGKDLIIKLTRNERN